MLSLDNINCTVEYGTLVNSLVTLMGAEQFFNNRMQVFTAVVNRVIVFRVVPRLSGLLGS
jgi:hypothetical protein